MLKCALSKSPCLLLESSRDREKNVTSRVGWRKGKERASMVSAAIYVAWGGVVL